MRIFGRYRLRPTLNHAVGESAEDWTLIFDFLPFYHVAKGYVSSALVFHNCRQQNQVNHMVFL